MSDNYPDDSGPSIIRIYYRWPDGRRELRYERPYPDEIEREYLGLKKKLGDKCPYEIEYV